MKALLFAAGIGLILLGLVFSQMTIYYQATRTGLVVIVKDPNGNINLALPEGANIGYYGSNAPVVGLNKSGDLFINFGNIANHTLMNISPAFKVSNEFNKTATIEITVDSNNPNVIVGLKVISGGMNIVYSGPTQPFGFHHDVTFLLNPGAYAAIGLQVQVLDSPMSNATVIISVEGQVT